MSARTVLLYGRSLLLSGVATGLVDSPYLRLLQASTWVEVTTLLSESTPDVIVFELTAANESHILPLLFKNPHVVMIGLDTEQNQAVLVSGHDSRALTLERVREIVEGGGPSQRDAEKED